MKTTAAATPIRYENAGIRQADPAAMAGLLEPGSLQVRQFSEMGTPISDGNVVGGPQAGAIAARLMEHARRHGGVPLPVPGAKPVRKGRQKKGGVRTAVLETAFGRHEMPVRLALPGPGCFLLVVPAGTAVPALTPGTAGKLTLPDSRTLPVVSFDFRFQDPASGDSYLVLIHKP